MDPVIAALLGGAGGIVATLVVYSILQRFSRDRPVTDADELAVELERQGKLLRRLTMQRLRQDALDAQPPLASPQSPPPATTADLKAELRRKVFGGPRA